MPTLIFYKQKQESNFSQSICIVSNGNYKVPRRLPGNSFDRIFAKIFRKDVEH